MESTRRRAETILKQEGATAPFFSITPRRGVTNTRTPVQICTALRKICTALRKICTALRKICTALRKAINKVKKRTQTTENEGFKINRF